MKSPISQSHKELPASPVSRISRIESVRPILPVIRQGQTQAPSTNGPTFAEELARAIARLSHPDRAE